MDEQNMRQITGQLMRLMLEFYYDLQEHPLAQGKFKLNSLSFHILFRLFSSQTGKLTIRELTEKMQISKPQLIRLVNNLEDEHLVIRERFKENRRIVFLSLSKEGTAYMQQILQEMENNILQSLAGKDSAKLSAFADGVCKIAEAMEL